MTGLRSGAVGRGVRKMDEGRVAATLRFGAAAGSATGAGDAEGAERAGGAEAVERSLLIHKDALGGTPTVLDFTKQLARDEEEDAVAAGEIPARLLRSTSVASRREAGPWPRTRC